MPNIKLCILITYLYLRPSAPWAHCGRPACPCPPPLRASTTGVPSPSVCCYFFRNPPARPNRRPRRPFTRGRRGRVLQSEIDDASTVVCRALSIRSDDGICRGQAIHAGDWSLKSSGARHFPPPPPYNPQLQSMPNPSEVFNPQLPINLQRCGVARERRRQWEVGSR
jgi:hypothetical protein